MSPVLLNPVHRARSSARARRGPVPTRNSYLRSLLYTSAARMLRVAGLHVYPVKSCKGIALERALLSPTGRRGVE